MLVSRHGAREIILLTVILGALAGGAFMLHWGLSLILGIVWLAGLAFFRDPNRSIPSDPDLLVAPADGIVTEITQLKHDDRLGGPGVRMGIFLSVLDVHVNRSPCEGRVTALDYQPGEFLDARHPDCGARNESNTITMEPEEGAPGPIVIRQVSGLIARRIVCPLRVGQFLKRGERFGMIKFGSRTELIVPVTAYEPCVAIGDRVWGGKTVMMRRKTTADSADGANRTAVYADENSDETRQETKKVGSSAR